MGVGRGRGAGGGGIRDEAGAGGRCDDGAGMRDEGGAVPPRSVDGVFLAILRCTGGVGASVDVALPLVSSSRLSVGTGSPDGVDADALGVV